MPTCHACTTEASEGAQFCQRCGASLALAPGSVVASIDSEVATLAAALGSQYEIIRLLGRGGMGAVYLAREHALERLVAIKILPADAADSADSRERFMREARTAAQLNHQNIVPLYTFGQAGTLTYIVMGYVQGESLETRLRRAGRLSAADVRRIMGELADALDYAHTRGVVHRDIKPDNVLLDDATGRAILTDFGIAKRRAGLQTVTQAGIAIGTPHYMSPEQATGDRAIDGRADLYSLGVMAYRMLSGRLPFEGDNAQQVILQHMSVEPIPIHVAASGAPADLVEAITRCLEKDPARRWSDGAELRRSLATDGPGDDHVPAAARGFRGAAWFSLATALGYWFFLPLEPGFWSGFWSDFRIVPVEGLAFGLLLLFGVPVLSVALIPLCRRHLLKLGLTAAEAKRVLFWVPDVLSGVLPWPASLRRGGDVWDRLPKLVKMSKAIGGISIATMLATIALRFSLPSQVFDSRSAWNGQLGKWAVETPPWSLVFWTALGACVAAFDVAAWLVGRWGKRAGLGDKDINSAFMAPTHGFGPWFAPRLASFLAASASGPNTVEQEPKTPDDFVRSIAAVADRLTGWHREVGAEAITSARRLGRVIQGLDDEIATLARDADPVELARLAERLKALDRDADRAASTEQRRMRELIEGQLQLTTQLAQRLVDTRARQMHMLDLMRSLWLHLANLRAQLSSQSSAATDISREIRALCATIVGNAAAEDETTMLVSQSRTGTSQD